MLLKSSERPYDYSEHAEPTKDYKVRTEQARISRLLSQGLIELRRPDDGDVLSPGLDKTKLQARYDPAKETGVRRLMGVYRVPLGISASQLAQMDKEKVVKWIEAMKGQGWDWVSGSTIETGNGVYPSRDLDTGAPDLSSRERIVRAQFRKREIEFVKTELRPSVLRDMGLGGKLHVPEH